MPLREYSYTGGRLEVTGQMKQDFDDAGYILVSTTTRFRQVTQLGIALGAFNRPPSIFFSMVWLLGELASSAHDHRGLLDQDDLSRVKEALEDSKAVMENAYGVGDGEGRQSQLCLWNHPGTDVTGMVARCEKVAGTCAELLGGEVYHYHTKLMMKEAYTGGKHIWHQDYGYWYKNGCLFPDMMTVFISLDPCKKTNGCLQILEGSQKCGRIEHLMVDGQTGADLERVKQLENVLEHLYVEMEPGDALFFHSNLLHTSSANTSPQRRWAFLCAYNRHSNNPVLPHHHPFYTPLDIVPNDAVKSCTNLADMTGKDFMNPANDKTSVGKK